MMKKIMNEKLLFLINGIMLFIMGLSWLLYQVLEVELFSKIYYGIHDYYEISIVLLLAVMLINRFKPNGMISTIIFLFSLSVGIISANNHIDFIRFETVDSGYLFRAVVYIIVFSFLAILFALGIKNSDSLIRILSGIIVLCLIYNVIIKLYVAYYIYNQSMNLIEYHFNIDRIINTIFGICLILMGIIESGRNAQKP